ncbi:unnamed protein product [Moneuplotes crassus]|uniref:Uncharacterized protein n=1 Tax=Euplotes crassus TaxID=5936 RepID=A0AAD1Y3H5_EUPCR|nr:unnamed protein product [Moneuplotes crassus]
MAATQAFFAGVLSLVCIIANFWLSNDEPGLTEKMVNYIGTSSITYSALFLALYFLIGANAENFKLQREKNHKSLIRFPQKDRWIKTSPDQPMAMDFSKGLESPMFIVETLNQVYQQSNRAKAEGNIYTAKKNNKENCKIKILAMAVSKLARELKSTTNSLVVQKTSHINSPSFPKFLENLELVLKELLERESSTKKFLVKRNKISKDKYDSLVSEYYQKLADGCVDFQVLHTERRVEKNESFVSLIDFYDQMSLEEKSNPKKKADSSQSLTNRRYSQRRRRRSQFDRIKSKNNFGRRKSVFSQASKFKITTSDDSESDDSEEKEIVGGSAQHCSHERNQLNEISQKSNLSMSIHNFPGKKERQEAQKKMKEAKRERMAELDKSGLADTLKNLTKLAINSSSRNEGTFEEADKRSISGPLSCQNKVCEKHPQIKKIEDKSSGKSYLKASSVKRQKYSRFSPRYCSNSQNNLSEKGEILYSKSKKNENAGNKYQHDSVMKDLEKSDEKFNSDILADKEHSEHYCDDSHKKSDITNLGIRLKDSEDEIYKFSNNSHSVEKRLDEIEEKPVINQTLKQELPPIYNKMKKESRHFSFDLACENLPVKVQSNRPNSHPSHNLVSFEVLNDKPSPWEFQEFSEIEEKANLLAEKINVANRDAIPSKFSHRS